MREDITPDLNLVRVTAERPSGRPWMISDYDIFPSFEALRSNTARDLTECELAEEDLCARRADCQEATSYLQDTTTNCVYPEQGFEEEERVTRKGSRAGSSAEKSPKGPLFPRRPVHKNEECLPGDAPSPQNSPEWTISAPLIERIIRRCYEKYHRTPTESELEEEIRNRALYRETLDILKDLEINMLDLEGKPGAGEEWLAYAPDGSEGDALLSCVRSEMQGLFRNAISNLPKMERLAISLDYCRYEYERNISVTLDLPDATIAESPMRVYLWVRGLLPNPDLGQIPRRTRNLLPSPNKLRPSEETREYPQLGIVVDFDVTVYGSQRGLLPTRILSQWGNDKADWSHRFTSWYCFDSERNLNRTRREEDYHLKLEI
jgi:hypothetical protein